MAMLHDDDHICKHCNKKTPHIHHCTPAEEAKRYTCGFCGTENVNHRHMCKEKLNNEEIGELDLIRKIGNEISYGPESVFTQKKVIEGILGIDDLRNIPDEICSVLFPLVKDGEEEGPIFEPWPPEDYEPVVAPEEPEVAPEEPKKEPEEESTTTLTLYTPPRVNIPVDPVPEQNSQAPCIVAVIAAIIGILIVLFLAFNLGQWLTRDETEPASFVSLRDTAGENTPITPPNIHETQTALAIEVRLIVEGTATANVTPTPNETETHATAVEIAKVTLTAIQAAIPTATPIPTSTPTITPIPTETPTPTNTPTPTITPTPTMTPSPTPTPLGVEGVYEDERISMEMYEVEYNVLYNVKGVVAYTGILLRFRFTNHTDEVFNLNYGYNNIKVVDDLGRKYSNFKWASVKTGNYFARNIVQPNAPYKFSVPYG